MAQGNFENSIRLLRLILRRERIISALWIILLVVYSVALAPSMHDMFPDNAARTQVAAVYDNPIMVAMMGPIYGLDNFNAGAMYGGMMLLWYLIAIAVMNIFYVVRHTRADEEKGRSEVIRSLPVGRLANLNATMSGAIIINTLLGLGTGLGLAAIGVEGMDVAGSLLYGAVSGATGLVFAAITALFCQISSSSGGATGLSMATLGIAYMIRAAGDMQGNDFLSCISPLGLAQRTQVYVANHWWPVGALLAIAVLITTVAFKLNSLRDLDQGFIAARAGRAEGGHLLGSSHGLAVRLLRNSMLTWVIVMAIFGASYGSVIGDIGTFVGDSPEYLQLIGIPAEVVNAMSDADKGKIIVEYFGAFVVTMMTLISIVPLLNAVLRIRTEEREGRIEHILARPVSRTTYLAGYVAVAFIVSILIQFMTAAGLYLVTDAVTDVNPFTFSGLIESFFSYLPALWVMIGVAVLLVGLLPKATGAIWGFFGFVAFVTFIGGVIDLPDWVNTLSPMHHIPKMPLEPFMWSPLVALTAIALMLTVAGFAFYNQRDIVVGD